MISSVAALKNNILWGRVTVNRSDRTPSLGWIMNGPRSPNVGQPAAVPHDAVSVGYAEWFGFMIQEFLTCV
jgi:hypothetical protein